MVKRKMMIGAVAAALTLGGTAAFASGVGTTETVGTAGSGQATTVNTAANSKTMISKTQAKNIALKAQKGTVDDIELKKSGGKTYYKVDIDRKWGDVDVWVDAYTGSILKVVKDDDNDDRDDRDDDSKSKSSSSTRQKASSVKYTAAQAASIAVKHVGGGTVTDNDLERENGRYVYEIDVQTSRGEADVKVDAATGKVLSSDFDDDDDDDDRYDHEDDDHDDDNDDNDDDN